MRFYPIVDICPAAEYFGESAAKFQIRMLQPRAPSHPPADQPIHPFIMLHFLTAIVLAHPGSGLEVASDGTIYVADVAHETIWRIDSDGSLRTWVTDTWTHEFHLAPDDALIYEREHTGFEQAPQSLHAITPDGERTQFFGPPPDRSRFNGTAFARAPDGSVTFTQTVRGEDNQWYCIIRQRDADDHDGSRSRTIAGATSGPMYRDGSADEATFRMIVDMRLLDDGTLVLLDRDRVRHFSPDGEVSTRGPSLIDDPPHDPPTRGGPETTWNRLYGLEVGPDGSTFVAYYAGRRIIRIDADGVTSVAYQCPPSWAPLGVAIDAEQCLVISEIADRGDRLRVLRLLSDGTTEIVADIPPN